MITLEQFQTFEGKADSANSISYTITGLELSNNTENYKVLAQGQLSNTTEILYTVPASSSCLMKQILLSNTTGNRIGGIKFYIGGDLSKNQIVTLSIPPNGSAKFDSTGWVIYDFLGIQVKEESLTTLLDDSNDPILYVGKSLPGTSQGSASWQIYKINTSSGIVITWADGNSNFDNIWNNRLSLSYS